MDVVILAGGKGTRMEHDLPKHLIEMNGKAVLAYQLDHFLKSDLIDKIILSIGHRAEEYIEYVKLYFADAPIEFSVEHEPLGTGGGIKYALKKTNSDFVIVTNADDITDINLKDLSEVKENTICIANPRLPFGIIDEVDGYAKFEEKPLLEDMWVSCGWYVFDRKQMLEIIPDKSSIEYDVFPKIKLKIYNHKGFWQPINLKKDISEFEKREIPESLK